MRDVLITVSQAEDLNRMVREKIDRRLFLTCNYAPTEAAALHADARFYLWIQDLYKFAVDASCIIGNLYYFVPADRKNLFARFRDQINDIRTLRAVIAHNNSKDAGFFTQQQLDAYKDLLCGALGKVQPETEEDFTLLCGWLEKRADRLLADLEEFVRVVAASCEREEIARRWETAILDWYSKKQDIYLGWLADVYLANTVAAGGMNRTHFYNIRKKLDSWIENALFADLDRMMQSCDYIIKEYPASAERARAKKEEHRRARDRRRENMGNLSCRDYFFRNLPRQLQETLEDYTGGILPQELLKEDIRRRFSGVEAQDFGGMP